LQFIIFEFYTLVCFFNFSKFILCRCLADEAAVLLLYSLLQGNSAFLEYVLVRTDLDTLVRSSKLKFLLWRKWERINYLYI